MNPGANRSTFVREWVDETGVEYMEPREEPKFHTTRPPGVLLWARLPQRSRILPLMGTVVWLTHIEDPSLPMAVGRVRARWMTRGRTHGYIVLERLPPSEIERLQKTST